MKDGAKPHVRIKLGLVMGVGVREGRIKNGFQRRGDAAAELWETKEAAAELANKEGGLRMRREGEKGSRGQRAPGTHLQLETQLMGYTTIRSSRILCRRRLMDRMGRGGEADARSEVLVFLSGSGLATGRGRERGEGENWVDETA